MMSERRDEMHHERRATLLAGRLRAYLRAAEACDWRGAMDALLVALELLEGDDGFARDNQSAIDTIIATAAGMHDVAPRVGDTPPDTQVLLDRALALRLRLIGQPL